MHVFKWQITLQGYITPDRNHCSSCTFHYVPSTRYLKNYRVAKSNLHKRIKYILNKFVKILLSHPVLVSSKRWTDSIWIAFVILMYLIKYCTSHNISTDIPIGLSYIYQMLKVQGCFMFALNQILRDYIVQTISKRNK